MIELKNVSKNYTKKDYNFKALSDVNLTISQGEIVGIIGHSGAGKSTLLRMINGLIQPSEGEVFIDGKQLFKAKSKSLNRMRHKIGMIFQHFNLVYSLTVIKNIMLNLEITNYPKENRLKRVREVLSLVGLKDKENVYPVTLSGGEKQRLGIARAISNNPKYLLSDEATSSLDPETSKEITNLLLEIHKQTNITIIL